MVAENIRHPQYVKKIAKVSWKVYYTTMSLSLTHGTVPYTDRKIIPVKKSAS